MTPRIWIEKIEFSNGSKLSLAKSDVVVIVGSNNAGKSATLRGIRDKLNSNGISPVVANVQLDREGSADDVIDWLGTFAKKNDPVSPDPVFQALGAGVQVRNIRSWWPGQVLHGLARFFCHLLTADERLQGANPPGSIAVVREPPTHPVHYLLRDERLERTLSDQFKHAFGVDLIVNRVGGSQVPLHVGNRPIPGEGQDRLSYEYISAIEELPLLHTQGDGMRSFAGVLLYTSVGRESIMLLDEPEAFLHPPQARHLGRLLVADKPDARQLFVATHSGDVLRGILDEGNPNVRVVRVRREGSTNHVRQLDNEKISELWSDPLLRYSNILDGLFHEKVIVCESDADARFYSAVADALGDIRGPDTKRPDVMFVHCGGKERLAVVIRALREVDVPVSVAADFDILRDERPLRDVVDAAGGQWSDLESDWRLVKTSIDAKKPELDGSEIREAIEDALAGVTGRVFPSEVKAEIQKLFRRSSPWAIAKEVGKAFVPAGDATNGFNRLVETLSRLGIFIVPVGELECFVRSIGNHGPRWTNEVLKRDLVGDPELSEARDFVAALLG